MLDVDGAAFSAAFVHRPTAVRHALADHPLLRLEAIAELADALPAKDLERHDAHLPLVVPGGAPDLGGRPSDSVRGIEDNGQWMVLWYIEQVPEYKALLDEVLADAEAHITQHLGADGDLAMSPRRREAFLFLSAPDAVTPIHFDPEQNFLLQVRGTKEMNTCAFEDDEAARRGIERYYDGGHRNLAAMPAGESQSFLMHPGDGVYVPPFHPHWVQNGPRASISLSITFRTRASEQFERVHQLNARLRRLRLSPKPPGVSPREDRAKETAHLLWSGSRRLLQRRHSLMPSRALRRSGTAARRPA
jgi:hypothetical protein